MKGRTQSSEVIILGAGASASFSPIEPPFVGTSVPFPMANDFFEKAIKHQILKERNLKGNPLNKALLGFIQDKFGVSFKDLKVNKLSVEEVYIELDRLIGNSNKSQNWTEEELNLYFAKQELLGLIKELFTKLSRHYGPCKYHTILAEHVVDNESVVISFNWDILLDMALYNTNKWFFETGYGVEFRRVYINKEGILDKRRTSKGLLLKPHGSINWFRYQDLYWSDKDGFTGEPVSEKEMEETHLFEFLRTKPPRIQPAHMGVVVSRLRAALKAAYLAGESPAPGIAYLPG